MIYGSGGTFLVLTDTFIGHKTLVHTFSKLTGFAILQNPGKHVRIVMTLKSNNKFILSGYIFV